MYRYHRTIASLALLSVLLRVLVPSGYMPSNVSEGWYLKLCHHGLTAEVVQILLGDHGHHHHHDHDSHSASTVDQCDLGSGYAGSALINTIDFLPSIFFASTLVLAFYLNSVLQTLVRLYNSRAPPFFF